MRRACIDIGSNTTRLLVADCGDTGLVEVHQERTFTHIGRGLLDDGNIGPAKLGEVTEIVRDQVRTAMRLGCVEVHGVATAAIRRARNGDELLAAIRRECGLAVEMLAGVEEARLAFIGAAGTLGHRPAGELGVVDVGGGSSELVVGTAPDRVNWCTSFGVGSGDLAESCLHSDPPNTAELAQARAEVASALEGLDAPQPTEAVAVGGSATSLGRLAGSRLDASAFARTLGLLTAQSAAELARRFALDVDRVRLLPAGLLILQGAGELFGLWLQVAGADFREGVLLEADRA